MPAFDLFNFKWNITPEHHEGNGDPFRYLWYRKNAHDTGGIVTTLHTTVEVIVDGYYDGVFDPTLTLVQYSSAKDATGQTIEDSIRLNVASSDDEGDVPTLNALLGETWREFLSQVSHAAQEKHALTVDRGELAETAGVTRESDVADMLTSALEMSKAAASPDHDEYDDALGGLFDEFEGTPFDGYEDAHVVESGDESAEDAGAEGAVDVTDIEVAEDGAGAEIDVWENDPNGGLELRDYTEGADAIRPGVSRRLSLDAQAPEVYVEDSPTEVMQAVVLPEPDDVSVDNEGTLADGADEGAVADTDESVEGTEAGDTDESVESKDDALPADLQAVLDKYGPDVLAKLLGK